MIGYHFNNALRGIRRSPSTSVVIILSIAVGIAVSITMIAFYSGMQVEPLPHKSNLVNRVLLDNWPPDTAFAEPDLAPPALTLQDVRNLQASPQAANTAAHYHGVGYLTLVENGLARRVKVSTRAATRGFFSMFEVPFQYGSGWDAQAEAGSERVVVIARSVNNRLFGGENSVGREVQVNNTPFRIVGIIDSWNVFPLFYDMTREDLVSDEVIIPLNIAVDSLRLWPSFSASPIPAEGNDFESRFATGESVFVQYWVEFLDQAGVDDYQGFLDGYVAEQRALGRFPRASRAELLDIPAWIERQQETGNQRVFMRTLVAVSLLFFGACLLNIVTLLIARFMGSAGSVSVLRALGVPRSAIFIEHLLEAALLGLFGGVLGLVFARAGVTLLGPLFMGVDAGGSGAGGVIDGLDFAALLDGGMVMSGIAIAIIGALLVALYPTWQVCRIAPSQYLKSL